jgi:hypothetical protein
MSFRDFKFPQVVDTLQLGYREEHLFPDIRPVAFREVVVAQLVQGLDVSQGLNTEKARSEFVIAPFLLEVRQMATRRFGIFSGYELDVDPERGLNGVCDFMLTHFMYLLRAPILAIAEAKNDNVNNGFGQCIATMHAAAIYNERAGTPGPVFGVSTTGVQWRFFRLQGGVLTLDLTDYNFPHHVGEVAAVFLRIMNS